MIPLAWTLLAVSVWTCGAENVTFHQDLKVLYPALHSNEIVECHSADPSSVYWFRSVFNNDAVEFIGKSTSGGRVIHGDVDKTRYKLSLKGKVFMLQINRLTEADTGIYSCVLKSHANDETWKPGTLLLPGVTPPTKAPTVKPAPPVKPSCNCVKTKDKQAPEDCASMVLWPLVGLTSALALALLCVLYYFSRLPKKCQHRFVKKR